MRKSELIGAIAEMSKAKVKDIDIFLECLGAVICREVRLGGEVRLQNVGTFKRVQKSARTARNPRTGEMVQVPAKAVVKFVPVKGFMD